ncbi:MAG: hypothetical protein U1F76_03005 [Candidatus Competibacteraceae bacterium]
MTPANQRHLLLVLSMFTACGSLSAGAEDPSRPFNPDATGGRPVINLGEPYEKNAVATIWNHADHGYVLIVKAEDSARLPNNQPIGFTPEQVGAALSGIKVKRGTGEPKLLFTEEASKDISKPLSDALAKAGPNEDIIFAVTGRQSEELVSLMLHRVVTTGRMFYKDGHLNLILGLIKAHYQGQFGATGILRPYTPGSRNGPVEDTEFVVAPAKGIQYANAGRTDWVSLAPYVWSEKPVEEKAPAGIPVAPVVTFPAPAPTATAPSESSAGAASVREKAAVTPPAVPVNPPSKATAETTLPSKAVTEPPARAVTAVPPPAPMARTTPPSPPVTGSPPAKPMAGSQPSAAGEAYYQRFEERLTALRKLLDEGLITEKEYQEKRRAILQEF